MTGDFIPHTEAQILASRIGHVQPLNGRIVLADYDPAWPHLFAREAERIRNTLGTRALRIEHAGSTSVPGLAAKPIVDMILEVADSADEAAYVPAMEQAGYVLRIREPDWFEHRLFNGPDTVIGLHVFSAGSPEIEPVTASARLVYSCAIDKDFYHASTHLPSRCERTALSEEAALQRGLKRCKACFPD